MSGGGGGDMSILLTGVGDMQRGYTHNYYAPWEPRPTTCEYCSRIGVNRGNCEGCGAPMQEVAPA